MRQLNIKKQVSNDVKKKLLKSSSKRKDNTFLNNKIVPKKAKLRLKKNYTVGKQPKGSIKPYVPQNKIEKGLKVLANPFTAAKHFVKKGRVPDNFQKGERNPFDYAADIINPVSYVDSAIEIVKGFKEGDVVKVGANALGFVPMAKGVTKGLKKNITKQLSIPNEIKYKASKSEIDWSKWNKEIPNNKDLIKEYNTIEQQAKANGTWMKNTDGSTFTGSPEQFVQQNSKNFKKAFPNIVKDKDGNIQTNYHGSPNKFNEFKEFTNSSDKTGERLGKGIYTTPRRSMALQYAFKKKNTKGNLYELYQNTNNPQKVIENFEKMQDIKTEKIKQILQNKKATKKQIEKASKDFDKIIKDQEHFYDNLSDSDFKLKKGKDYFKSGEEQVVPYTNYPKSMKNNNGMFDMTNPNIYKSLTGVSVGASLLKNQDKNKKNIKKYKLGGTLNTTTMKKKRKLATNGKVPKHFLGALLSTGIGLATSAIGASNQKRAQARAEETRRKGLYAQNLNSDKVELEEFENDLNQTGAVSYYQAKGGKLAKPPGFQTKGGKLKPLSSDMVVAKGNKHEESKIDGTSGIKLMKGGKAFAEIEDDETIKDGKKVYSDRITLDGKETVADKAKKLAIQKGLAEKRKDNTKVNALDNAEDKLFIVQENIKKNKNLANLKGKAYFGDTLDPDFDFQKENDKVMKETGVPYANVKPKISANKKFALNQAKKYSTKPSSSSSFSDVDAALKNASANTKNGLFKDFKNFKATDALSLIDNVGNLLINANTPNVPKPTLERIKNNKTKVNVNPQLANVNNAVASTTDFIKGNTANSNTARANISSAKLKGAQQKAQINSAKENTETQLYNQNQAQARQTIARNAAKTDQYNLLNMQRTNAMAQRASANFANLSDDFIGMTNRRNLENFQDKQLQVMSDTTRGGVGVRALMNTNPQTIIDNKKYYWNSVKGTADEPAFLQTVGMTAEELDKL